jgi:hypothetical protein
VTLSLCANRSAIYSRLSPAARSASERLAKLRSSSAADALGGEIERQPHIVGIAQRSFPNAA